MHEGPVLLVDNAIGDEEAEEAHTDQAQTHKQKPLSLTRLGEIQLVQSIYPVSIQCPTSMKGNLQMMMIPMQQNMILRR